MYSAHRIHTHAHTKVTVHGHSSLQWVDMLEDLLSKKLTEAGLDVETIMQTLIDRKDELDAEVFDLLVSLSDFEAFKALMLDYKNAPKWEEGGSAINVCSMHLHQEEQEDGEERPDLDMSLNICGISGAH